MTGLAWKGISLLAFLAGSIQMARLLMLGDRASVVDVGEAIVSFTAATAAAVISTWWERTRSGG